MEDNMEKNNTPNKEDNILNTKEITNNINTINELISQASINLYGVDKKNDDVEKLNEKFNKILASDIEQLTTKDNNDITSFLSQIISSDKKNNAQTNLLNNQFMALTGDDYGHMQSFIYEAYRNRLLEQHDLHEVASQLIELSEAILITRDAIISADVIEGRLNRTISFSSTLNDDDNDAYNIIETIERKFKLHEKVKDFIVPKTLEYGTYYIYIIPYSKLFTDFMQMKNTSKYKSFSKTYGESFNLMESFDDSSVLSRTTTRPQNHSKFSEFIESTYNEYIGKNKKKNSYEPIITKEEFSKDMSDIMSNISVCNDPIPIPVLEEGVDTMTMFRESFVNESGDSLITEENHTPNVSNDLFNQIANGNMSSDGGVKIDQKPSKKEDFSNVKDCYIKMLEPTRVIPINIMDTIIGYYYVQDEDITPISGAVSSTLYYTKFEQHRKESTIVDAIASQVVKSFNKKFLDNNTKFKKTIVDCISYYNLNEKRLKFQFIPVEYMQEFAIDRDVNGVGQSMIKKSLFYAKLYLMLLLFKIMTIIMNSNDTKVNYLRQSGINKNLSNKVQQIARTRQNRQINIADLFSYTTLINKVGNGSEMYIPTGQSGERLLETEILQGQDVQLNSDLLEMLKNAYILATGVPAANLNNLSEAEFAKELEQRHSKFNGRVVNYQLDFNPSITEFYKKILKYCTDLSESEIAEFRWAFKPPKSVANMATNEMIQQFETLSEFLVKLLYGDSQQNGMEMEDTSKQEKINQFKILLAKEYLPNIDIKKIKKMFDEAELMAKRESIKPNPAYGDQGNDSFDMLNDDNMGGI